MNRFRNPLAISTVVVWRRSSVWVMCPMIEMCALVARAGAVLVSSASGRPSQAERSVGDSVESSRPVDFSTVANSGSITSSRLSTAPGSGPCGSRTAQISPSPLERPVVSREVNAGSACASRRAT